MLANCLGSSYGVFGIAKPNANLDVITSIMYRVFQKELYNFESI
jgi:hypothetical protein